MSIYEKQPQIDRPTMLIGERWSSEGQAGVLEHRNPSTGQVLGRFAAAGPADVEAAVTAAKAAFPAWRQLKADRRRDILLRWAQLIEEHRDEFSRIATLESGHPISFGSLGMAIDHIRYNAGWVDKLEGQILPVYPDDAFNYVSHEPYGVVAAIVTWNGPVANSAMKVAPALAAGNSVILKTSELGPFGPALFAELALEAGIPAGVLNVLAGGPGVGDALTRHPGIGKISFTGSVSIARLVLQAAAVNITPVVLELGGKSANIVFPDADLDQAAIMGAHMSTVAVAGQGCLFPTRMLVHNSIYDAITERVLAYVRQVKQGDPTDPSTMLGPVISERACERIMGYIDAARREGGGKLLTGGARAGGELASGYFIEPTVFGDVDNSAQIAREEIFGPVLSLIRFETEEEAIRIANDTVYGLAGYVHTQDLRRAHRVARELEAGYIGVNSFPPMPASAPFGGWKQSGQGKEGGRSGIEEFLRLKNVYVPLA